MEVQIGGRGVNQMGLSKGDAGGGEREMVVIIKEKEKFLCGNGTVLYLDCNGRNTKLHMQ